MKEWMKNIRKVEPYVPGEQPHMENMIKLNTNENPYPPAPGIERALKELDPESFRLYPDPLAAGLIHALAQNYGRRDEEIFAGVGSDDVLATAFLTFFNSGKPILFPDITYSFYDVWAQLFKIPYERPYVDGNFRINPTDYFKENGGVVIANPNAPTSIGEEPEFIEEILRHNKDVVVIVDEAYIDFGKKSSAGLIDQYDNLLVVQTFSKSRSMAGIRIGYAMGNKELIKAMNDVKYSYNSYTLNQPSLILGEKVLEDNDYFEKTRDKVIKTREETKKSLLELGFTFPDSKTNFLFITHESVPADKIYQQLREKNIFVRYFNKPGIDNYLRVTMGTDEQMKIFLTVLKEIVK